MDYNFADSLGSSIDLGVFPYFKRVHNEELTLHQQDVLRGLSRRCGKEPAKLISAHRRHHHVVDFFDNIAYLLQFHSCAIVDILSIVSFRTAPFLQHYVQTLQDERSRCASNVLSRVIKNLSNRYGKGGEGFFFFFFCAFYVYTFRRLFVFFFRSIPGKLHQRTELFSHCSVATNKDRFLRLANHSGFVDFLFLGPHAAIAVNDGISVHCRNLPSISARVYRFERFFFKIGHYNQRGKRRGGEQRGEKERDIFFFPPLQLLEIAFVASFLFYRREDVTIGAMSRAIGHDRYRQYFSVLSTTSNRFGNIRGSIATTI